MLRHKLKISRLAEITLTAIIIMSSLVSNGAEKDQCRLLVNIQNDLRYVDTNGASTQQLTQDQRKKDNIAVSPNGMIAFSQASGGKQLSIIDSSGRLLSAQDIDLNYSIDGLKWISSSILQVAQKGGPNTDGFLFYRVSSRGNLNVKQPLAKGIGTDCAYSEENNTAFCVSADETGGSILKNGTLFFDPSHSQKWERVQKLNINVGKAAKTLASSSIIEILKIDGKLIGMKITASDHNSREVYQPENEVLLMTVENSHLSSKVVYGVSASIEDKKKGRVSVEIVKNTEPIISFENAISVSSDGKHLATIQVSDKGRSLIVLDKTGRLIRTTTLSSTDEIVAIAFNGATRIKLQTKTQLFEWDLFKSSGQNSFAITNLPSDQINVLIGSSSIPTHVISRVCN